MATVFWDAEGIILVDFLEQKKTVTATYYVEVLQKLKAAIIKTRSGKLHQRVLLYPDNPPAHSSRQSKDLLRELRWEILQSRFGPM
ncbi:Mariner Mos1 transposase [Anthophora plagiata]